MRCFCSWILFSHSKSAANSQFTIHTAANIICICIHAVVLCLAIGSAFQYRLVHTTFSILYFNNRTMETAIVYNLREIWQILSSIRYRLKMLQEKQVYENNSLLLAYLTDAPNSQRVACATKSRQPYLQRYRVFHMYRMDFIGLFWFCFCCETLFF